MSTSVSNVVSHFPSAENGFTTTTSGSVSSGATTVGLNSVAGYTNGEIAVFVIDPTDAAKKQTFTGTIDTAGVQVTNVVWTAGTNQTHALGATVVDYATATHISMVSKGILVEHEQDGTHGVELITSRTEDTAPDLDSDFLLSYDTSAAALKKVKPSNILGAGWSNLEDTPDTVTYNGNRSYDLVFNSNDLTDTVSNGMRLKLTRTVTAPTQCADLEASSSHYFNDTSVSGMTFTDDFVVSAWIKLESYTGATATITSRWNGTSGWAFQLNSSGQVFLTGYNAGAANYSQVNSYQSLPLNKWVHVTAQLDMSTFTATTTTSYVMIDGVNVPATVTRGGTNPTALIQAGNLEIGGGNGGLLPFDGKLAQVAIYSAKVTQATIQASISQTLTGSETSLVSAYTLSNSLNDLSANANNLTAQNSAVATATDTPFAGGSTGTTEYGIITANAFSTNTTLTVQVPEGYAIPTSGGVSAVAYSTQDVPYGFPRDKGKWALETIFRTTTAVTSNATYGAFASGGYALVVPIGAWLVGHIGGYTNSTTTTVYFNMSRSSLTGLTSSQGYDLSPIVTFTKASAAANTTFGVNVNKHENLTTQSTYTMQTLGATTSASVDGATSLAKMYAEFNYV